VCRSSCIAIALRFYRLSDSGAMLQTSMNVLISKVSNFLDQPVFIQLWFLPVWLLLGLSKLIIRLASFNRLAPKLGIHLGANAVVPLLDEHQERRALMVGRVVRISALYTPWDSNCFPQAVTAKLLLSLYRIPYALYFGLRQKSADSGMQAHAWVAAGRVRVSGGASFDHYTVVGCFVSSQLATVIEP
jgi:hypothetical protein